MSGHKRSISNVDDTLEVPPKVVKTNDLDDASTRAQDLEAQIAELQDFIVAKGLHLEAPSSIRNPIEARLGATVLGNAICGNMREAYDPIYSQTWNSRRTGVSSDDLSSAMMEFFPEVERLASMKGGNLLAIKTLVRLGEYSFGDLDEYCGYGERPSDEAADALLMKIGCALVIAGETKWMNETLSNFKTIASQLVKYGVNSYFTQSSKMLEGWTTVLTTQEDDVGGKAEKLTMVVKEAEALRLTMERQKKERQKKERQKKERQEKERQEYRSNKDTTSFRRGNMKTSRTATSHV